MLIISVDAATNVVNGKISVGVVVCNSNGELVAAFARPFSSFCSPFTIELIAFQVALKFCVEARINDGYMVSVSQAVVKSQGRLKA